MILKRPAKGLLQQPKAFRVFNAALTSLEAASLEVPVYAEVRLQILLAGIVLLLWPIPFAAQKFHLCKLFGVFSCFVLLVFPALSPCRWPCCCLLFRWHIYGLVPGRFANSAQSLASSKVVGSRSSTSGRYDITAWACTIDPGNICSTSIATSMHLQQLEILERTRCSQLGSKSVGNPTSRFLPSSQL